MPIKTLDLNYAAYEQNFNYRMGFDTAYHTQNFIYSNLVNGVFVDPPMVQVLTQFLQPGDTFMDIGSHIGYYSLLARQVIGLPDECSPLSRIQLHSACLFLIAC